MPPLCQPRGRDLNPRRTEPPETVSRQRHGEAGPPATNRRGPRVTPSTFRRSPRIGPGVDPVDGVVDEAVPGAPPGDLLQPRVHPGPGADPVLGALDLHAPREALVRARRTLIEGEGAGAGVGFRPRLLRNRRAEVLRVRDQWGGAGDTGPASCRSAPRLAARRLALPGDEAPTLRPLSRHRFADEGEAPRSATPGSSSFRPAEEDPPEPLGPLPRSQ
jgi:hypothetical protein